jgi:hypothetical protein
VPAASPDPVAYAANVHTVQIAAAIAPSPDVAPFALRLVLLVVLLAIAALLGVTGYYGWRGRLSMAGRLGVRTEAALADWESFELTNRVAGLPTLVAGVIAAFSGAAAFGLATLLGTLVAAGIGLIAAVALTAAGGVLGDRAAKVMLASKPTGPASCVGCACGGCEAPAAG